MIEYALPDTINGGTSAWREAMRTSAGTPLTIFTLLVIALTLYSVSAPGGYLIPVLGSMLGWIIVLEWWDWRCLR